MKLLIEIDLGNDRMRTAQEATSAITGAILRQASSMTSPLKPNECGAIRDANGNTVGKWEVA